MPGERHCQTSRTQRYAAAKSAAEDESVASSQPLPGEHVSLSTNGIQRKGLAGVLCDLLAQAVDE